MAHPAMDLIGVINGGGKILREYGLGRGALDLLVEWPNERHAIEIKIRRGPRTETPALQQSSRYLDRIGLSEGWLVMFDRRKIRWDKKIYEREVEFSGKRIRIVGG